jgi:hypothetical protein
MVALSTHPVHAQRTPERLALIYGDDKITDAEMMRRMIRRRLAGGAGHQARPRGCTSEEE